MLVITIFVGTETGTSSGSSSTETSSGEKTSSGKTSKAKTSSGKTSRGKNKSVKINSVKSSKEDKDNCCCGKYSRLSLRSEKTICVG